VISFFRRPRGLAGDPRGTPGSLFSLLFFYYLIYVHHYYSQYHCLGKTASSHGSLLHPSTPLDLIPLTAIIINFLPDSIFSLSYQKISTPPPLSRTKECHFSPASSGAKSPALRRRPPKPPCPRTSPRPQNPPGLTHGSAQRLLRRRCKSFYEDARTN